MIAGMEVSNKSAVDKKQKQPDALYSAMECYYVMGHNAFWAERQQKPVQKTATYYDLDAQLILSRKSGYARLHAPEESIVVMGVDINYVGLNWTVMVSDASSQSRRIVAHGIWPGSGKFIPKKSTDDQACALIRKGIAVFSREVVDKIRVTCLDADSVAESKPSTSKVGLVGWDASNGKWQDATCAAIKNLTSRARHMPLKAFGSRNYRPRRSDLRQGKGWHITKFARVGRVLVINADYWRETLQRGFVVEPTEPGAVSLYEPDRDGSNILIANEIAGERLVEKVVTDKYEYYRWSRTTGVLNDRADSAVYACALTGVEGIGEEKKAKTKKANVVIGRRSNRR